jgi:putative tRNA adenosine deaminase-associated protein
MTSGRVTVYFAALLARTEDGWEASDTELDDVETLSDLADLAREAAPDEDTVLVLIEQEDAWFGVVRVDGEEDPRVFVSNAAVASRSSYGELLLTDLDALDLDGTEDGEPEDDGDTAEAGGADALPNGPVGDSALLDDLGVSGKELLALDGDALTEIADALGASEMLEAVR